MYCAECGKQIPDGEPYCRFCGAPSDAQQPQTGEGDREIHLLLTEANLLRARRQYREAEAKCGEVLSRQPNSVSAHSLMGDIYRDQGRSNDAIEWYKLALDLDPSSRADRDKLQKLLDRVYAGGVAPPALSDAETPPAPASRSYFRRLSEASALSPNLQAAMIAVVLVLLVGLAAVLAKQRTRAPDSPEEAPPQSWVAALPQPQAPSLPVGLPVAPAQPAEAGGPAAAAVGSPPTATADASDIARREQTLLQQVTTIGGASGETYQLLAARISRLQPESATVSLVVPPPTDNRLLRQQVLNLTLRLAQGAFQTDAALKEVAVEVDAWRVDASGGRGRVAVFAGRALRDRIGAANFSALSPDQQENLLSQPTRWFIPDLQSAASVARSGASP